MITSLDLLIGAVLINRALVRPLNPSARIGPSGTSRSFTGLSKLDLVIFSIYAIAFVASCFGIVMFSVSAIVVGPDRVALLLASSLAGAGWTGYMIHVLIRDR